MDALATNRQEAAVGGVALGAVQRLAQPQVGQAQLKQGLERLVVRGGVGVLFEQGVGTPEGGDGVFRAPHAELVDAERHVQPPAIGQRRARVERGDLPFQRIDLPDAGVGVVLEARCGHFPQRLDHAPVPVVPRSVPRRRRLGSTAGHEHGDETGDEA